MQHQEEEPQQDEESVEMEDPAEASDSECDAAEEAREEEDGGPPEKKEIVEAGDWSELLAIVGGGAYELAMALIHASVVGDWAAVERIGVLAAADKSGAGIEMAREAARYAESSCLMQAVQKQQLGVVRELGKAPFSLGAEDTRRGDVLCAAIDHDDREMMMALAAAPYSQGKFAARAMYTAATHGMLKTLEDAPFAMSARMVKRELADERRKEWLMLAALASGDEKTVERVLQEPYALDEKAASADDMLHAAENSANPKAMLEALALEPFSIEEARDRLKKLHAA